MNRATSAEDYKLISSFESIRAKLLQDRYADRLVKPLAYWALPNDRRLPLAFLGRTVGDLLKTPFDELTATPGIGQKKISSMVKLLHRATRDEPPAMPFGISDLATDGNGNGPSKAPADGHFDPAMVSEVLWSRWCLAVKQHNVGHEKLGRLAPSLQTLPTVIWDTSLSSYVDHTLGEIRSLRTHGEKRVRCVLEVFHAVYEKISSTGTQSDLAVRLMPKFVMPIESWIVERMLKSDHPTPDEVRQRLAMPLLDQIKIDCGETVHGVTQQRLGIGGPPTSVRMQAEDMGVTRARVYQLLDDCSRVMRVRWPEGKSQLDVLAEKFEKQRPTAREDLSLFYTTKELCFPDRHHHGDDRQHHGESRPSRELLATVSEGLRFGE